MAKKKKTKIGLFDLLMMIMALVGLVLAVVGMFIPFFSQVTELLGNRQTTNTGLFDDYELLESVMDGDLTIGLVQAFVIASVVLTALATAVVLLGKLGVLRFKGLVKLLFAVLVVIVIAALVITFAATYAAQSPLNVDAGDIAGTAFIPASGAYLVMAGGVVSGVALLVSKLK